MSHYLHAQALFDTEVKALLHTLEAIRSTFDAAVEIIAATQGKVVVTGIGKSGIIAHKISATLASTGTPSVFLNASEALHGDLGMVSSGDVVIMLSKSGTTVELIKMMPTLERLGVSTIGIFGNIQTQLAQKIHILLDASVEKEGCPLNLAPMSSTTVALVIGDAIAAALMQKRQFQPSQFAMYHPAGQLGRNLLLTAKDVMHQGTALPKVHAMNTIKEVVITLTQSQLGAVCVCDEFQQLIGFITDGDIRRFLTRNDILVGFAHEIMTQNPVVLLPEMPLSQVLSIMENPQKQIYVAPVVDECNKCLGLLRIHDIFQMRS